MVVFNCNACGEALKKNQVEKHISRCRQCQVLSCVDCGKDFWGNDYQSHTKCMTEEEKYCGKGYVPKVNKGEVKQEQWIEKVQAAIEKSATNPGLKSLLERLKDYPNIPRKKAKFENFLKNSLRTNNESLINQVWDLLMAAAGQETKQNGSEKAGKTVSAPESDKPSAEQEEDGLTEHKEEKKKKHKKRKGDRDESGTDNDETSKGKLVVKEETSQKEASLNSAMSDKVHKSELQDNCCVESSKDSTEHKLSKRERKEERRKKANKKEKEDKNVIDNTNSQQVRKGKKRNLSETEEVVHEMNHDEHSGNKKKKHKQESETRADVDKDVLEKDDTEYRTAPDNESSDKDEEEASVQKKMKKKKFKWEATVLAVLQSKGEMSLKKLRKKVLNEFAAQDAANYSEDNLKAKFDKKINKMAQVKVFKDRVKLK